VACGGEAGVGEKGCEVVVVGGYCRPGWLFYEVDLVSVKLLEN